MDRRDFLAPRTAPVRRRAASALPEAMLKARTALRNNPDSRMAELVAAIKKGKSHKVQQLIGLDTSISQLINAADANGHMPLHNAVAFDQLETVAILIELGADVNCPNKMLDSPLHVACKFGQVRSASLLIYFDANVQQRGMWMRAPLHYAAAEGHVDCIKLLLKQGVNPMPKTSRELDFANSPLHLAAWFGRTESIDALLAPNLWHDSLFVDIRDKPNADRNTPLHLAAFRGQLEAAHCLLKKGANFEAKGKQGRRPIHVAAVKGYVDVVRLLMDFGAEVKARSGEQYPDFQQTAIHLAAYYGEVGVIEALLERHPKLVNMRCFIYGQTPLHRAVQNFQVGSVNVLLQHGADMTLRDDNGWTALKIAKYLKAEVATFKLARNRAKIIKLLLDHELALNSVDRGITFSSLSIINDDDSQAETLDNEDHFSLPKITNSDY